MYYYMDMDKDIKQGFINKSKIKYVSGDEWVAGNLSYHLKSRPVWLGISGNVKSKDTLSFVDVYEDSIIEALYKVGYFKVYGDK